MTQFWWHVARAAGLVAWLFGALSLLTGLALASRAAIGIRRSNWQLDLHRIESTIAMAAIALHLIAIVADSYVHIALVDLVVPGHATWRPGALSWGVVALYLLVIVEATSLGRRRISKRAWHRIHLLSVAGFGASTVHAFTSGTDTARAAVSIAALTASAIVIAALVARSASAVVARAARPPLPADAETVAAPPPLRSTIDLHSSRDDPPPDPPGPID